MRMLSGSGRFTLPYLPGGLRKTAVPSGVAGTDTLFSIFFGRLGAPKNGEKPDASFGSKKILPEGPGFFWEAFWSRIGQKTLNFRVEISGFSAFFLKTRKCAET